MIVTAIYIKISYLEPEVLFTADNGDITADTTAYKADRTILTSAATISEYKRIELFNDEEITISSTIKNFNDMSKLFADFSKVFTIPATPYNNTLFKHWYENSIGETDLNNPIDLVIDTGFDHRITYDGYIEIDTIPFKAGKFTMQKANIKNNQIDSYSINFVGTITQLSEKFKDRKLNTLSGLNNTTPGTFINYTAGSVLSIVTNPNYNATAIQFPIIGSNREYQYLTANSLDVTTNAGSIVWTDLFPSFKLPNLLSIIQAEFGIQFTGAFFSSKRITEASLYCKNAQQMTCKTQLKKIEFKDPDTAAIINVIRASYEPTITEPVFPFNTYNVYRQQLEITIIVNSAGTNPYNLYIYNNGILFASRLNQIGSPGGLPYSHVFKVGPFNEVFNFEYYINSDNPVTLTFRASVQKKYLYYNFSGSINPTPIVKTYSLGATTFQTSISQLQIKNYIPDITINDFMNGLIKMHNLMIIPISESVFEFIELENWYNRGKINDITEKIIDDSIEISKPNLFKKIDFKYETSQSYLNDLYYTTLNQYYGDLFYENAQSSFSENYELKLPFENVIWRLEAGTNWLTTTLVDKSFSAYTPKPMIIYNNGSETLTTPFKWNNLGVYTNGNAYRRFSNELLIGGTDFAYLHSLNWGAETSPFYQQSVANSLYSLFYQNYIANLYNQRSRVVKVKGTFTPSEIAKLYMNDRIVLSNKRYLINNLQINLSTGLVDFELISDFRNLIENFSGRYSNLPALYVDNTAQEVEYIIYISDYDNFDVKAKATFVTNAASTGNTNDILLNVTIAANTSGVDRADTIDLEYFKDGVSTLVSIPITQTL